MEAQENRYLYPVSPMPLRASRQPRSNGVRSFQASFFRQAQVRTELTHLGQLALDEQTGPTTSLAEQASLKQSASEGETSQSKTPLKHPSAGFSQLDLAQLEHKMLELEALKEEVRSLCQASTSLNNRACRSRLPTKQRQQQQQQQHQR